MSVERFVLIAAVATLAATHALAKAIEPVRSVDLSEAINKTVCPIKVDIDEDANRVPRRIKIIKCAQELHQQWCKARHIPQHECCQNAHPKHRMECVEMRDTVLVFYKDSKKTTTYEVSVGCTCMIEQSTEAPGLSSTPT